jgi:hypothetical protein
MQKLRDEIERLTMRIHYRDQKTGIDAAIAAWRAAVAALRADPTGAELPPLPGET